MQNGSVTDGVVVSGGVLGLDDISSFKITSPITSCVFPEIYTFILKSHNM